VPQPGLGGALNGASLAYLVANRGTADWILAVDSANTSAPIQLATGQPVMAMGGFTGSDPAMTLDRLAQLVSSGRLRFVLSGGFGFGVGFGGRAPAPFGGGNTEVADWVAQHCASAASVTAGLYDCANAVTTVPAP
jgi:hypothetical protein